MNVRVTDAEGQTLAAGRDLDVLRRQLGAEAADAFTAIDDPSWNRDGLMTWDFDELPVDLDVVRGRLPMKAYPALVDGETSVSLRLLDSPQRAVQETRIALRRLFLLAAGREVTTQVDWLPGLDRARAGRCHDPGLWPAAATGRVIGRSCLARRDRTSSQQSGLRGGIPCGPAADWAGGAGSGEHHRAVVRCLSRCPHCPQCGDAAPLSFRERGRG